MAPGERRGHGIEGVSKRRGDLLLAQIARTRLDVASVGLQPLVIVRGDPVAEDVHRLRLALEPDGQLLGDEHIRQVRDRSGTLDRVVIGDRDEVHSPPLGEFVDLHRLSGTLGELE